MYYLSGITEESHPLDTLLIKKKGDPKYPNTNYVTIENNLKVAIEMFIQSNETCKMLVF